MTVKEISQIYYTNLEIKSLELELAELKEQSFYKPVIITDMPRGGSGKDANVEYVDSVMEIERLINYRLQEKQNERERVEAFLQTLNDPELESIMRFRAINNMSWREIGEKMELDRRTVSRKFYGFFEKSSENVLNVTCGL